MSLLFEGTANTTMHVNTTGQLPVLAIIAAEISVRVLPHSPLLKAASPVLGEFLTQVPVFNFTSLRWGIVHSTSGATVTELPVAMHSKFGRTDLLQNNSL